MAWQTPKTDWKAGDIPSAGDFNRIEENIRIIGRYDRAPAYAVTTGSANAYSVELDPAPNNYYDGMCVAVKIHVDNTGASTLNVNGLGARPIKKPNGQDVVAGNLKAGIIYTLRYNGQNFILQGSDSAGNAMPEHVLAGKTFSNDNGPDQVGTMPNQGQKIIVPGTTNIIIPRGYHDGTGYVEGSPNLLPENIRKGVTIFGVTGTLEDADLRVKILFNRDTPRVNFELDWYSGTSNPSVSIDSTYINMSIDDTSGLGNKHGVSVITSEKIDVTPYKYYMVFGVNNTYNSSVEVFACLRNQKGLAPYTDPKYAFVSTSYLGPNLAESKYMLGNISSLSGEYYFQVGVYDRDGRYDGQISATIYIILLTSFYVW